MLSVLCGDRFSDDHVTLDILTAEAFCLLALASGERPGALAALAYPQQFEQIPHVNQLS